MFLIFSKTHFQPETCPEATSKWAIGQKNRKHRATLVTNNLENGFEDLEMFRPKVMLNLQATTKGLGTPSSTIVDV